ncbi:hypothetical protein [Sandaracinobacteroides hominis]|uniref:hypothetical protein n=1 Tax=Sandaracinobacteroides hominis TaxID=2780086 RepID=UPI0018F5EEDD|nr:hypothetical protein [Sandaracinobacteroides hominis]
MKTILPLLAFGLLVAAPAAAADTTSPAPAANPDAKDPDAIRCRRIQVTGSLVKKEKVCKTNAEWNKISDQQRRDGADLIDRSRAGMNPSN